MAVEVIMPKAGMDMQEGKIIQWFKNVGDKVSEGDALLEIETDKVNMEVEATNSGVLLAKYYEDGEVVPVVTVIGFVGAEGEKVEQPTGSIAPTAPSQAPATPVAAAPAAAPAPVASGFEYDVAVIGGGPAGYVAAIKAAQLGGKVVIFEKDVVGGTCLNRGCIPTKTYIKTAEYMETVKHAASRGVNVDVASMSLDMPKVVDYKNNVVKQLTGGVAGLLKSNGVTSVAGAAKLTGKNQIEANGKVYEATSIILCGGSKAGMIPIPGIDQPNVMTSDGILDITEVPERLAIIGGGVIGCEIATAFNSFGSKVTVVEMADHVVPVMDKEVSVAIKKSLKKAGVKVLNKKQVEKLTQNGDKPVLHVSGEEPIEADIVLLSIGRFADLECLGTLADEIKMERGKVVVDDAMRTSIPNIYAAGDINGKSMLAHAAFKMGEVAAANALGHNEVCDLTKVPGCLYTMPEAASVGLTEDQAKEKYSNVSVGKFPFPANGRALASGETEGFVKVIIETKYGEILGAHIVGPSATEMIMEAKVLIDMEITVHEVCEMIHPHPTFTEAFMEACADALGQCIHLPKK